MGLDSRSAAEKVTVFPETDPEVVESTGTLNSIVTVAPVDGHGMTIPPFDERMLSKAAEKRVSWVLCRHGQEGKCCCSLTMALDSTLRRFYSNTFITMRS